MIGGDFNMVELLVDKKRDTERGIHPLERAAWDAFLFSFTSTNSWLEDAFVTQSHSLLYYRSNRRR